MEHTMMLTPSAAQGSMSRCTFPWQVQAGRFGDLSVAFSLVSPARVRLSVRALSGGHGKTLFDAPRGAGDFADRWAMVDSGGRPLAPGMYMVTLELDGEPVGDAAVFKS